MPNKKSRSYEQNKISSLSCTLYQSSDLFPSLSIPLSYPRKLHSSPPPPTFFFNYYYKKTTLFCTNLVAIRRLLVLSPRVILRFRSFAFRALARENCSLASFSCLGWGNWFFRGLGRSYVLFARGVRVVLILVQAVLYDLDLLALSNLGAQSIKGLNMGASRSGKQWGIRNKLTWSEHHTLGDSTDYASILFGGTFAASFFKSFLLGMAASIASSRAERA